MLGKFLRWLAEIGQPVVSVTKHFSRPRHPVSQFAAEQRAEGGAEEAGAVATPTENDVADLTTTKSFTAPITAGVKVDTDTPIGSAEQKHGLVCPAGVKAPFVQNLVRRTGA